MTQFIRGHMLAVRARTLGVLSGLAVCLALGALASSCSSSSGGGGGGGVGTLAPIGDISGNWLVSVYSEDDGCDPQNQFTAELMAVLVIQGGNDVQIVAEDGSDLPDVVGGSIQGTLKGDQLEFSFTVQEDDGTREFTGVVEVGPNLRSFRSSDGTCISWQFIHDTDAELNCEGAEVWTGQMADLVQLTDPEVVIDPNSSVTDSLEIDQEEDIAEIKVNVDVSTNWANSMLTELESPDKTVVKLSTDFGDNRATDFNLIFSDTGLNHGQLPPIRESKGLGVVGEKIEVNADVGAEMLATPTGGDLADFNGGSTLGKWSLTVKDTFGDGATLNSWGILVNFGVTPPPPNVAGTWALAIFAEEDDCPDLLGKEEDTEQTFVLIEQNGPDVTIKNGDGLPFDDIIGGVIEGTLKGTTLSITYSEEDDDGITTFEGSVVFSDFLNGIRAQQLFTPDGLEWSFVLTGEEQPLCTGVDFWKGRKLDTIWTPELVICSGSGKIGPQVVGGERGNSVVIEIDEDIEIGEIEVLTDVRSTFFAGIDEVIMTAPDEATVLLYSRDRLEFNVLNRLSVLWADREGLAYGDFPPIDFSSFSGRMEAAGEAPLSQFQGDSTDGMWQLDIVGGAATVDAWCIIVNDELPPLAEIFEECSENTPLDYEFDEEKGEKNIANLTDTLQVDVGVRIAEVEISVDITQSFIANLATLNVTSPVGTTVKLASKGLGKGDDLDVIWSDDGIGYADFPKKGGTTFGGRMQPVGSLSDFDDEPSPGEWTLHLEAFESGTLNDWCVIIEENL